MKSKSLTVHGARLFNSIPRYLRDMTNCSKERFKSALDPYLKEIPDEPQIPGYTALRRAESNSLQEMLKIVKQRGAACPSIFQASSTAASRWKSEDFGHDK